MRTAARRPERGEVYWVDFEPRRGSEQGGVRPALVVQNDRGNQYSPVTVVVALSSAPLPRVYPFTVPYGDGELAIPGAGHVNCAQLLTVDISRLGQSIGKLSVERMRQVDAALRYELAL